MAKTKAPESAKPEPHVIEKGIEAGYQPKPADKPITEGYQPKPEPSSEIVPPPPPPKKPKK